MASIIDFCVCLRRPSKEGFDIVIGNPPYLESRSPNFPESLKVSLQSEIQKRRLS
ncbi:Eco57I restriction-modification methylase domain-containing protein, partial [Prevotella intermedia]